MYSREDRVISVFSLQPIEIKDDTLPFKRQALAWENETKPWIQGFQTLDFFWLVPFALYITIQCILSVEFFSVKINGN